jgi:riboflavin synthase
MFTGIIEEVGTVAELEHDPKGGRLRVHAAKIIAKLGVSSSVAVSGCCLTVTRQDHHSFWCDLAPETLHRTGFHRLHPEARVNLEAPLTLSTPLGGHMVQGHVDGTGTLVGLTPAGDENWWLEVNVPESLTRYIAEKGSVAVEGISLTVAVIAGTRLRIAIIPYTCENTNLATLQPADPLNLECDVLAKYVEKLLSETRGRAPAPPASQLTLERLIREGF